MPFFSRPQHGRRETALRRTAWWEHGMASVNHTRPHSVNQMGKTHSKPLAARHAMCESTFKCRYAVELLIVDTQLQQYNARKEFWTVSLLPRVAQWCPGNCSAVIRSTAVTCTILWPNHCWLSVDFRQPISYSASNIPGEIFRFIRGTLPVSKRDWTTTRVYWKRTMLSVS